ncbi:TrkH family potassium uptake protein [Falsirhodobacter algicola]|uniref:Trk system potassium uptake protein n=1 Tax=Falsirhodobacter algicola TaxID=2692330 RepID=A0A8J8MQL4_9RHOB|nr:TrkH family potassium uptake protein [Falsirhodobacter algicola]QUS34892.1 potassium transporter TrkH [Falsirhodobacter algicola]
MIDLRPVGYVIGLLVVALGAMMLFPAIFDWFAGDDWTIFVQVSLLTMVTGGLVAIGCANGRGQGLNLHQVFLLTVGVWVALPMFGALPFMIGETHATFTDSYFEAVSGVTTTGATMFTGLDDLPVGINLWRGILHWLGGLGIVIVAMLFLPVMKVGGMQFFKTEGFDTLGKVMPRALDISSALIQIYIWMTVACGLVYNMLGMSGFDALMHALSTVSTGGFSSYDASFGVFAGPLEYAAVVFMLAATLPFIRYVQILHGQYTPIWRDPQARAYLRWNAYAIAAITLYQTVRHGGDFSVTLRETTFNVVSAFSGTGFTSTDLSAWDAFPFAILIGVGLIGGCTASTGCSVKVFRYIILFEAIRVQIRRIYSPNAVLTVRYDGQLVKPDVLDSVILFFAMFLLSFGVIAVLLSLTGLDVRASITAAWTSIANVGPVFGSFVAPSGALGAFPISAKWVMILGMLLGRLELLTVFVLFMPRFWMR